EDQDYDVPGHGNGYYGHYPNIDASDLYDDEGGYTNLSGMHATQMKARPQPLMNSPAEMMDEGDEEEAEYLAKLSAYHYNPEDYHHVQVPSSLSQFMSLITDHVPEDISLPLKLR